MQIFLTTDDCVENIDVRCRYSNGDVYKGAFVDGKKQGHGVLKQGKFSASVANVYVGQWQADKRHGYGVCDDIPKGGHVACRIDKSSCIADGNLVNSLTSSANNHICTLK